MERVKLSSKYRVEIPKEIRKSLKLVPGQEFEISVLDGTIRLSVRNSVESLRGIAKGLNWKDCYRDRNDRY